MDEMGDEGLAAGACSLCLSAGKTVFPWELGRRPACYSPLVHSLRFSWREKFRPSEGRQTWCGITKMPL